MKLICVFFIVNIAFSFSAISSAPIKLFAAASLTDVLAEIIMQYEKETHYKVVPVFASSSTLAQQIIHGSPANLFFSANKMWIDKIDNLGLIDNATKHNIVSNKLLLISQKYNQTSISLSKPNVFKQLLKQNWLAMGDPGHVPAGLYGKEALKYFGLWNDINNRVIRTANVRAVTVFVSSGESLFGIVYKSSLKGRKNLRAVFEFPKESHSPILYFIAAIKNQSDLRSAEFINFLKSKKSADIFKNYGFSNP